jgi:hypothetical protein
MKAAKRASQIKRFVRLFGGHASETAPVIIFRRVLRVRLTKRRQVAPVK